MHDDNSFSNDNHLKIWEWRGFWPSEAGYDALLPDGWKTALASANEQSLNDTYLIIPNYRDNYKIRDGSFELKSYICSHDTVHAYAPKQRYDLPLSPEMLHSLFPELPKPTQPIASSEEMIKYTKAHELQR